MTSEVLGHGMDGDYGLGAMLSHPVVESFPMEAGQEERRQAEAAMVEAMMQVGTRPHAEGAFVTGLFQTEADPPGSPKLQRSQDHLHGAIVVVDDALETGPIQTQTNGHADELLPFEFVIFRRVIQG